MKSIVDNMLTTIKMHSWHNVCMVFWAVNPDCVFSSKDTNMQNVNIKSVKQGDYFKRKPDAKTVYIRGEYCKASKAYSCIDAEDINKELLIKGDKLVVIGFTY
jgi:hypothetical protein